MQIDTQKQRLEEKSDRESQNSFSNNYILDQKRNDRPENVME